MMVLNSLLCVWCVDVEQTPKQTPLALHRRCSLARCCRSWSSSLPAPTRERRAAPPTYGAPTAAACKERGERHEPRSQHIEECQLRCCRVSIALLFIASRSECPSLKAGISVPFGSQAANASVLMAPATDSDQSSHGLTAHEKAVAFMAATLEAGFDRAALAGLKGVRGEPGRVVCRFPVTPERTNRYGTLHGGCTGALCLRERAAAAATQKRGNTPDKKREHHNKHKKNAQQRRSSTSSAAPRSSRRPTAAACRRRSSRTTTRRCRL